MNSHNKKKNIQFPQPPSYFQLIWCCSVTLCSRKISFKKCLENCNRNKLLKALQPKSWEPVNRTGTIPIGQSWSLASFCFQIPLSMVSYQPLFLIQLLVQTILSLMFHLSHRLLEKQTFITIPLVWCSMPRGTSHMLFCHGSYPEFGFIHGLH